MDPVLWNLNDYCATPNQFTHKTGVCEDYAISIHISLLILGFNPNHMRIVVRQDLNLKILHAVLVVYLDGQQLVPDNQIKQVIHTSRLRHYKPIYFDQSKELVVAPQLTPAFFCNRVTKYKLSLRDTCRGAPQMQREASSSGACLLLDYVQRLERHREGGRAVHIHLSKLKAQNRREHHLRIAENTFDKLTKQFDRQVFAMQNGDIVFVCRDASIADMDDMVQRLRRLLEDDPLAQSIDPGHEDLFCNYYNVESQ